MWMPVNGYENLYLINESGQIKSIQRNIELKPGITEYGYAYVILYNSGSGKMYKISRLVAFHFITNPNNCREVNHKDGNKLNNHIENLEWCTRKSNVQHAWDIGLNKGTTGKTWKWKKKIQLANTVKD
jgi:hypothetical protein